MAFYLDDANRGFLLHPISEFSFISLIVGVRYLSPSVQMRNMKLFGRTDVTTEHRLREEHALQHLKLTNEQYETMVQQGEFVDINPLKDVQNADNETKND